MKHLYPKFLAKGQDFSNVARVTVPKQSLSLREILRRYVRREPLPSTTDGVYEERFGDLEKMSKGDIIDQMENVEVLKGKISRAKQKELDRIAKIKADAEAAAAAALPKPTPTPPS